eukprot:15366347-Ditylum_brightwellii.AAC.2
MGTDPSWRCFAPLELHGQKTVDSLHEINGDIMCNQLRFKCLFNLIRIREVNEVVNIEANINRRLTRDHSALEEAEDVGASHGDEEANLGLYNYRGKSFEQQIWANTREIRDTDVISGCSQDEVAVPTWEQKLLIKELLGFPCLGRDSQGVFFHQYPR